jgi:hypothetical protein
MPAEPREVWVFSIACTAETIDPAPELWAQWDAEYEDELRRHAFEQHSCLTDMGPRWRHCVDCGEYWTVDETPPLCVR